MRSDEDLIIDPSEIIIEKSTKSREDLVHANPWARLLARFFDYSLFFLLLLTAGRMVHGSPPAEIEKSKHENPNSYGLTKQGLVPLEFFCWIPLEATLLWAWGSTPGKAFLKIRLRQGCRLKLDFHTAMRRSFNVWFRGMGMMIPVINFFCLFTAYYRLKTANKTSWDANEQIAVEHRPIGRWRVISASVLIVSVFGAYAILRFNQLLF